MKLTISPDVLVAGLQKVIGVIERRLTLPILSNILCSISDNVLQLTATDLEVEIESFVPLPETFPLCQFTVPGRKFLDICKSLSSSDSVEISHKNQRVTIKTTSGQYSLATLPANDFPNIEEDKPLLEFELTQGELKAILEKTQYAMAEQDVRFYLNGMLWEVLDGKLHAAAMDGHRFAYTHHAIACGESENNRVLVPRKGIVELNRLLEKSETPLSVRFCANHLAVSTDNLRFRSKLIDGAFPDYKRLLHSAGKKVMAVDKESFKKVLSRVAILTNDQNNGVRLEIKPDVMRASAVSHEQDEAWEELSIQYEGDEATLGFNVSYVLDVLSAIDAEQVTINFDNTDVASLFEGSATENSHYIVMPLRL